MGDWERWLGRQSSVTVRLQAEQANRMAVTLDREPVYQEGDTLPPAWHWLYFHELVRAGELGADGHPRLGVVLPPVPLARRMWAGGSLLFHAPLRLGATIRRSSTISAIEPKTGRAGPLYFVTVEHRYSDTGALCLVEQQTLAYREPHSSGAPPDPPVAPEGAQALRRYQFDSTALFRYSALTFNGHRIHYDADYCREVEHYPGLVVHGPLIATMLLDLHAQQGWPLHRFSYQARSPLCLPGALIVNAKRSGAGVQLWASDDGNRLLMQAAAE